MDIQNIYNIPKIYNIVTKNPAVATQNTKGGQALKPVITKDVFERNFATPVTSVKQITATENTWNNARLEAIYNKTYDIVMQQNPITDELNIKNPH